MEKHKILAAFIPFFFLFCTTSAFAKTGPIPIRNQMPLYLFFLQMEPDRAGIIEHDRLEVNAGYTVSNITVSCFTPVTSLYNINIDAEVSRMTLDLRYGISEKLEAGLEVPYLSLSAGYLDEFVEGFEDTVGATTPRSRTRQGSYNLNYSFIYNNQNLIKRTNASDGLGDIVLKAKYQISEEDKYGVRPNVSFRTALKLPTGQKDDLLGSGELDYGFGILLDKTFSEKIIVYTGFNFLVIEKPSFFSALNLRRNMISGLLGVEYLLTERVSIVAQATGNSTPYPSTDTNALDESAIDIGLGINYRFKGKENVSWHFAFTENLNSASSPDVSIDTGFNVGF